MEEKSENTGNLNAKPKEEKQNCFKYTSKEIGLLSARIKVEQGEICFEENKTSVALIDALSKGEGEQCINYETGGIEKVRGSGFKNKGSICLQKTED